MFPWKVRLYCNSKAIFNLLNLCFQSRVVQTMSSEPMALFFSMVTVVCFHWTHVIIVSWRFEKVTRERWTKPQWPSGLQCRAYYVWHRRSWVHALNLHQCLQKCLQVCGSKRLGCHADLYTVGRCHTRVDSEESVLCRWESMQARESTLALKPRADIIRSPKQGY